MVDHGCCCCCCCRCSTAGLWAVAVAVTASARVIGEAIDAAVIVVVAITLIIIVHNILDNLPPPIRCCSLAFHILDIIIDAVAGVNMSLVKPVSLVKVGVTLLGSGSGSSVGVKVRVVVAIVPIGRGE